jgi:hypothetical protein
VADLWLDQMEASMPARLLRVEPAHLPHRGIQRRAAGAGGRRSQASTQVVSRG